MLAFVTPPLVDKAALVKTLVMVRFICPAEAGLCGSRLLYFTIFARVPGHISVWLLASIGEKLRGKLPMIGEMHSGRTATAAPR